MDEVRIERMTGGECSVQLFDKVEEEERKEREKPTERTRQGVGQLSYCTVGLQATLGVPTEISREYEQRLLDVLAPDRKYSGRRGGDGLHIGDFAGLTGPVCGSVIGGCARE